MTATPTKSASIRAGTACALAILLGIAGCRDSVPQGTDLTQTQVAYTQLLGIPLPADAGSLQGYTRVGSGYHSYLRFKPDAAELKKLLSKHWQTEACDELRERITPPPEAADRFKPAWAPMFELSSRCYTSELSNHWGSADHILVVDASGYVHFHGVAR